nr:hypothetical protein [Tanacetum cinerariifolium]
MLVVTNRDARSWYMISEDAKSWVVYGNGRTDGQGGQVGGQRSEVNDAQVSNQGRGQGNGRNQNGDAVNDHIGGDVGNVIKNNDYRGCTYKDFLACNPKEASHAAYTDRFHKLARLVPHLVTLEGKSIESEALSIGSIKKNPKKRGNIGEPRKDRNVRDDNKRTRNGNTFATTPNPVRRENTYTVPKCTTCSTYHPPRTPYRICFNYNCPGHFAKDCRDVPGNVNLANPRNPTARVCYECGSTDHIKSSCPRFNQAQGSGGNRPNQALANNRGQGHGNQEKRQDEGNSCWE